jgi:hypothetical protein
MGGSDLTRPNTLAFRGKRENQSKVGGFVNQVASVKIWLLLSKFGLIFYNHVARHIHRGIIKAPTVSILCYTYVQDAWQTNGQRHNTTQLQCVQLMCPSMLVADKAHKLVSTFPSLPMCEAMLSSCN